MKTEKLLAVLLGILLVAGGIAVLANPAEGYGNIVVWALIAALLITSVYNIYTWNYRKKKGEADGWDLGFAIVALLLAVFLIISVVARMDLANVVTIILMVALIILGLIRVAMAVMAQRANKTLGGLVGKDWALMLCAGILLIIAGIVGIAKPVAAASVAGFGIGIAIIALGVEMIVGAFARKG